MAPKRRYCTPNSDGWRNSGTGNQNYGTRRPDGWRREPLAAANYANAPSPSQRNADGSEMIENKAHYFTDAQCNQILNLLNNKEPGDHHANLAGIATCLATCLMTNFKPKEWIVDSGATHHITSSLDLLKDTKVIDKSD